MTDEAYDGRELRQLLADLLDSQLSSAQTEELRAVLHSSSAARDFYARHVMTHAMLQWEHAALVPSGENRGAALAHLAHRGPFGWSKIFLFGLALCAVLFVSVVSWHWWPTIRRPVARAEPNELQPLAPSAPAISSIQLQSGTTTLSLDNIGSVVVEGPADFKLIGPMRCRLNSGRIRVHVSQASGHGFVVETPDGEVTDLGTEFGLEVTARQNSGLVVFKGAVDLRIADDRRAVGAEGVRRLEQGEGVLFERGGSVSRVVSVVANDVPTFRQGTELPGSGLCSLIEGVSDNLRATSSTNFYEIVPRGLHEGVLAYVDRDSYEWIGADEKGLPAYLNGADYVKPFNNDKLSTNIKIVVSLAQPARLFVFLDDRLAPPQWLKDDFQLASERIVMDDYNEEGPSNNYRLFSIWQRTLTKSGPVTLGPCQLGAEVHSNMYGIAAVPLEKSETPKPREVAK
jgi:FecR protein